MKFRENYAVHAQYPLMAQSTIQQENTQNPKPTIDKSW